MVVHQLLPRLSLDDNVGRTAVALQLLLRRLGHFGELYAHEVEDGLDALVRPWTALRPRATDVVLLHHGAPSPMSSWLLTLQCRKALYAHSPGPSADCTSAAEARTWRLARAELSALAPLMDLVLAPSDFDANALREAGAPDPYVLHPFIEPERFGVDRAAPQTLHTLRRPVPTLLAVGCEKPHQRLKDVLALHREHLRLRADARLLLLNQGPSRKPEEDVDLPGVTWLGHLPHAERVAAYHASSLLISMSEHESFPGAWVEAMAVEIPVLAFNAGAAQETTNGHGVLFDEKDFAFLAELTRELCTEGPLRARVLEGQNKRVRELSVKQAQNRLDFILNAAFQEENQAPIRRQSRKPRVALIVQRYGEMSGGAEAHARQVVERLKPHFDWTVLTTRATDHLTWENTLGAVHPRPVHPERRAKAEVEGRQPSPAKQDRARSEQTPPPSPTGDPQIYRFSTTRTRSMTAFNALSRERFRSAQERLLEEHWLAEQGPLVPELHHHLATQSSHYDAFLFFTYLYAPTVWGLPQVAHRSLLVPTAHDEPAFNFDVYNEAFTLPAALLCNTPEEVDLITRRFPEAARARVVGVGVDEPAGDPTRFAKTYGLTRPYLLYVGRVEKGKGIPELLAHHASLVRSHPDAPELILAGAPSMQVKGERVRLLGRISDEAKRDGLAGALATVIPSRYESLSLLALESFAQGTPVLANGGSEVLSGQVHRSEAGVLFRDAASFADGVFHLMTQRPELAPAARAFARRHTWSRVIDIYREEVDRIMKGAS